jgi:hypothetical protein
VTRVRLYRYRLPESQLHMFATFTVGHGRRVRLRDPGDDSRWLELVWLEDGEEAPEFPEQVEGLDMGVELFPGTFLPHGTVLEGQEEWEEFGASFEEQQWREHRGRHDFQRVVELFRLGRALAARLAPHIPAAFQPEVLAGWISDRSRWVFEMEASYGGPELLAEAARRALDTLQDEIAETTTDAWPAVYRGGLAPPDAEVREGALHVWFGARDDAVLFLDPIPIADLVVPIPRRERGT